MQNTQFNTSKLSFILALIINEEVVKIEFSFLKV